MMKYTKLLFVLHFLVLCSLTLTSCSNEDNSSIDPTEQLLQDGEWTGSDEGRSGSIIAKVLEKQGIVGGNTNYSTGGINAAETDVQKSLGIEDSKDLFYDDTMRGGKQGITDSWTLCCR